MLNTEDQEVPDPVQRVSKGWPMKPAHQGHPVGSPSALSPHIRSHTCPSMRGKVHEPALRSMAQALFFIHWFLYLKSRGKPQTSPAPQTYGESSTLVFHRLLHTSQSPGGLVKTQIADPFPQDYDSIGWGLEGEHFWQVPRWCDCCWPRYHTWRTTGAEQPAARATVQYSGSGWKECDVLQGLWTGSQRMCVSIWRCSYVWVYVCSVAQSCPTLLWSYGLSPARLLSPWDFPGKNTGVGCHVLF